jgi:transcription termination/antitermination protein NusG
MLKLSKNPPIIWPNDRDIRQFEGMWWVAHTKSRNEKALAWQMQKKDINYFLPLTEKVYKKSRRIFRSMLPLFSGYVFFCGDEKARLEVLKTNRTANLIKVEDQQLFVSELEPIEKALTCGFILEPHNYIEAGRRCRVIAGPLMGTEGIVTETQSRTRLVLGVDILGKATCLEIDSDMLEPIN